MSAEKWQRRQEQLAEFEKAKQDFGNALLASWPGRQLERFVAWLSRRIPASRRTP